MWVSELLQAHDESARIALLCLFSEFSVCRGKMKTAYGVHIPADGVAGALSCRGALQNLAPVTQMR